MGGWMTGGSLFISHCACVLSHSMGSVECVHLTDGFEHQPVSDTGGTYDQSDGVPNFGKLGLPHTPTLRR
jgi:hypothetical protein